MTRTTTRWLSLVTAAVLGLLAGCKDVGHEANGVITLRYGTPYAISHPFSRADVTWMKHVEKESGGRLKIEPYWGGSLIDEDDSVRQVAHGVADIGYILPIYARAGAQMLRGQLIFYDGVYDMREQERVFAGVLAASPEMRKELAGVLPLVMQGGALPQVMTRSRPVRTLADLKGLRLRAPAEMIPVFERLGVDAEFMPMGEVYTALSKGTIDGVAAAVDTLRSMRFAEVVKYVSMFNISRSAYPARAMNLESWKRLPPDQQKIIEDSRTLWTDEVRKEITRAKDVGEKLGLESGVEFIPMSAEELHHFHEVYQQVATEQANDLLTRHGLPGPKLYEQTRAIIAARPTSP